MNIREYTLEHWAADLGLNLGGGIIGSAIVGKVLKDKFEKERKRVEGYEKKEAEEKEQLDKLREKDKSPIMRTINVKNPGLKTEGWVKPALKALAIGGGMGAAFTAMDRATSYTTAKKDKELALKAAKLELEKEVGKKRTEQIEKKRQEREARGEYY